MMVLTHYLSEILITLGIIAFVLEVAVFGFSTLILFFIGIGFFITGLLMQFGWLDANVTHAVWSVAVLTFGAALLLWKPFRNMQNGTASEPTESDFAQKTFELTGDICSTTDDVLYRYSGIDWKVRSQTPLKKGQWVKVIKTEVSVLWVEPTDPHI